MDIDWRGLVRLAADFIFAGSVFETNYVTVRPQVPETTDEGGEIALIGQGANPGWFIDVFGTTLRFRNEGAGTAIIYRIGGVEVARFTGTAGHNLQGLAWTTWTPDQQFWTLGNGTLTARYVQLGNLVIAEFELGLGSTSTISAGFSTNYPVTPAAGLTDNRHDLGIASYLEAGTAVYSGTMRHVTDTRLRFFVTNTAGTYAVETAVSDTVPFAFTTNDFVTFRIFYEAAA